MLFTIVGIVWLVTVVVYWRLHRNRYWLVATKTDGKIKAQIIHLPLKHIKYQQLRREIKIFNKMNLVMESVDGVAVIYREQMKLLLRNPSYRPEGNPYQKLLYGYACDVLSQKLNDEIVQQQLRRNLMFLFAPQRKIVKRIKPKWSQEKYVLYPLPVYKVFCDCYCNPLEPGIQTEKPWQVVAHGSYLKYYNQDLIIKRYAHAYTLFAKELQTITLKVALDKNDFNCTVSRGVVTCKHLVTGEVHTYAIRGDKVRLATSVCAKVDALEIYITWQGDAKICLDGCEPKKLMNEQIQVNKRLEQMLTDAYQSKYVQGERLRARYLAAQKIVPSLGGFTKVIALHTLDDFWKVWNDLADYRRLACLVKGFNLVFLYSSALPEFEGTILSMFNAEQITACHNDCLWLYFVDRTVIEPDALYFFTKLTKPAHYVPVESIPMGLRMNKCWPYVKTLTVTNTLPQKMTRNLIVPLVFRNPSVVSANGSVLTVVGLDSGYVSNYVLPVPVHLTGEWLTTHINIPLKVKLAGYETRQFTITRRECNTKKHLTKKELALSLSEIQVCSDDKRINELFKKTVVESEDANVLAAVKVAYQNQDKKLLLAALSERHQITTDVWQYLLTQFIGIRVRAEQIYLSPCVNVMGEFVVSFKCKGQKYAFSTKKNLSQNVKFANISYYGNSKR